jgi:hypothetical protein
VDYPEHNWGQQREQLSALLDNELGQQEQAELEAHLRDCAACRAEMDSLWRTRALLHALPQPALPRNFALPLETAPALDVPDDSSPAQHTRPAAAHRLTPLPRERIANGRRSVRILQWISTVAAVFGVVLLLSGAFSTLSSRSGSASIASFGSNNHEASGTSLQPAAPTNQPLPHATPGKVASNGSPIPTQEQPTPTSGAGAIRSPARQNTSASPASGQIISAADLGLLLLLLSVCGFATTWILRRRWQHISR